MTVFSKHFCSIYCDLNRLGFVKLLKCSSLENLKYALTISVKGLFLFYNVVVNSCEGNACVGYDELH